MMFYCDRGKQCKPIYIQIARQVVQLSPEELRLPARAWKVKLIGEGADDAGGVFDDTITEMCQVRITEKNMATNLNFLQINFFSKLNHFSK